MKKMSFEKSKQDRMSDKKYRIKEGSAKDMKMDKAMMKGRKM